MKSHRCIRPLKQRKEERLKSKSSDIITTVPERKKKINFQVQNQTDTYSILRTRFLGVGLLQVYTY